LLAEIAQPDLATVRRRAGALRRRRTVTRVGGLALAAIVAAGLVSLRPWGSPDRSGPEVAATPSPSGGPVWSDAALGLTVNGMIQSPADPRGEITDVEFVDADRGFAVVADCTASDCRQLSVVSTADGGLTWAIYASRTPLPARLSAVPDLLAFGPDQLMLAYPEPYYSADGGNRWWPARASPSQSVAVIPAGAQLRVQLGPSGGCGSGVVEVWVFEYGHRGDLAVQPPIAPCWTSGTPAADGSFWVGGMDRRSGVPALAVTRDRGKTWQSPDLAGSAAGALPGAWAQVSTLGAYAYAVVVGPNGQLGSIYRSVDRGERFTRTRDGASPATQPGSISGEAVPMLSGGLLIVGTNGTWYVSDDDGTTFRAANDEIPKAGRLVRTPAGYVALDLFGTGWAAYSSDGATWRKLHLN
jgi:photosystem II stability/assembly factor-like uncharacterized protein